MDEEILVLTDEDGVDTEFEILDVFEYQGDEYIVLQLLEDNENEPVHILRIAEENLDSDEARYEGLDDEYLIDTLFKMFKKRNGL